MPRSTYALISSPSARGQWNQDTKRIIVSLFKHGFAPEEVRGWALRHMEISGRNGVRYRREIDRFVAWGQQHVYPDPHAVKNAG